MQIGDLRFGRFRGGGWFFLADNVFVNGGVLQLLWKYMNMKILCDWFFHKLIRFLGPPGRLILVPPNPPLDEFGVFRRLLFFFDDHVFAVLAISVYVSTLFVLLPFSIGWVVLATFSGGSYFSPVILGYMMMLSVSFAYFGILFTLHRTSFPVIVRWLSLGFRFITVTFPCHLLTFLAKSCKSLQSLVSSGIIFILRQASLPVIFQWFHFMTVTLQCHLLKACKILCFTKDAFVLFFKIGALPCIVGWFLETCVSPMFGTTVFQRYEIFSHGPCMMMAIRWLSGLFCLITAVSYMEHIQKIIHERAFWYLLDVTDPDYNITKLYLRHIFFVFASHGLLLVILFRLPTKAITLISPSFFPLELWITDDNPSNIVSAYAIYFNLMHVGPQWLIQLTKPTIELMVHKWIITVSTWLQLSDFLLVVPRGESFYHADDNPWLLLYSVCEGSLVTFYKSQNDEDNIKEQRDNRCRTRIAIMLMLAASSLFLVGTAFLSLPIVVGRVFSASISSISFIVLRVGIKHDDICAFWIGCYILRAIYVSLCFAFDHILRGRTVFLLKYILARIRIGLLFSIWIFIIPGLLGLLIDLMIIIPLRVPLNETPLYFLIQDWLIGVVVLHIWAFLTMLTPFKCLATKAWRRKFERIRNVGINKLPSMWLLRDVIGSIINTLLTTLSIPYVLVKSLLPLLGFSQSVSAAIERFIWPASLALLAVWFMTKLTLEIIIYLHELIFNERYMVGERVGDLTEDL
ncbi:probable E3 ubiquitin ligase SUD1 [Raphanus sativus]|uniref:Probable E3 ubiquitin ligase SUD1 n=1 Tax=Raphanus sativus TaxID=3726 RepID=A0A9W3C9Z5_RAPSA|nr:probable E3 ubiquitin ligase SUD1 [Raphanus sativus]XP_056855155.1 probable E3 ubiquitin ligase SUD1 [Raphanus sativus]